MIPAVSGGFRRDVEGLRAVAVLAVVAYHAGVPFFGGGFVGVDVFFVISGFLITRLLLTEIGKTGGVALGAFWARRARRLLPASAVVLVATAVASALILPTLDQAVAMADIMAAALYVANWRFAGRETDYLADDIGSSPVLHFWSLGVEEQFYVFWPLLLVALAVLTRRRSNWRTPVIAVTLTLVWVASFAGCWYITATDQPLAFFSLPTRAWQLATGGLLAIAAARLAALPTAARIPLGWTGMALIVTALLTLAEDGSVAYPGLAALLPTAGAAFVLAAGCGSRPDRGPVALLGLAPLQFLGRISYSWYLWHWPPLVLVPAALDQPLSIAMGLAISVTTLPLAYASYALIETPARQAPLLVRSTRLALATGALLTLLPAVISLQLADMAGENGVRTVTAAGPDGRVRIHLDMAPEAGRREVSPLVDNECQLPYSRDVPPPHCAFGAVGADRSVMLFGDSHASQWFIPLDEATRRTGKEVLARTKGACPVADVTVLHKGERPFPHCDSWRERILAEVERDRPEVVIVSATARPEMLTIVGPSGPLPEEDQAAAWQAGLATTLERLRRTGTRVVLIRDTPYMTSDVRRCLAEEGVAERCDILREEAVQQPPLDVEVARRLGIEVWDFTDKVCTETTCRSVVDGVVAWYDEGHLSASFARTLSEELVRLLQVRPREI